MTTKKTPARRYTKGMGTAVADRTINRKIRRKLRNPEYQTVNLTRRDDISLDHQVEEYCLSKGFVIENYSITKEDNEEIVVRLVIIEKDDIEHWKDVAKRVALGNSMLRKEDQEEEFEKMHHHLRQASLLMSGRHLQHGDATQPERNIEIFTNCSTSATSFLSFYLLLNGSGVGRSYDDDMMLVDWKYMPTIITTIDQSHADILSGEFSCLDKRMAEHLYSYKKIHQFDVPDSREGWAKAIEKIEVMTHSKKYFEDILLIDFSKVRPKGSPIGGMQNRPASGPAPLINAINNLSKLRDSGMKPWRATMYIDHYLAECVLVGGARRAARMATKHWTDPSIEEFISIKQGGFLWSSNNSVTVDTTFWESLNDVNSEASRIFDKIVRCSYFDGTGEPGLINQDKLTQNKDGLEKYADGNYAGSKKYVLEKETLQLTKRLTKQVLRKDLYHVTNPCGEVSLMLLGGYCTIADVVPYHAQNDEDAEDAFRTAARALIRVNTMDSLYSKEVSRTNRIGVGITGLHEWIWKRFGYGWKEIIEEESSKPMWLMLSRFKRAVSEEARNYSAEIGSVTPHTDTTQKPAGCRPADSLTTTTQGILTLDELFENHKVGETWGEYVGNAKVINEGKEVQNIQRTFDNGKSKTTKIKLAYGMVVESTENHPWFVKKRISPTNRAKTIDHNDWVRTDKLEKGDILDITPGIYDKEEHSKLLPLNSLSVRMRGNNNEITQPTEMNSDLAWFFGYLWGDGSMSPQKFRLRWTDRNIQNLHKVNNILEEQFGIKGNIFREKTKDAHTLEVGNKLLWHWLIKNGVYKYFEGRIDRIPVCVRKSSQEDIIAFIAGLIDSDGAIIHGDKDKTVIFSQADYDFCNHMQHVAASVGLIFGFSRNSVGENWQQYRREMYLMTMGVPSKKKAVDFLVKHSTKCARWNFPGVIWRNEEDGNARKTLGKIESIEDGEMVNTYDIEVENSHWFYAGAVKSHNTTSKLFSLTEGAHLPSMREYLRWVQFRNDDPLVDEYKKKGYPIRKLTSYSGTTIVGFPTQPEICKLGMGDKLVTAAEATPEEQYEYLRLLEKYWITGVKEDGVTPLPETGNQISYTLKYDPKKIDFEEFKKTLREGQSTIRCCSVMPQGDATAYEYQPEEPVTKVRYQQISQEIQEDTIKEDIGLEHVDCGGGACPIDFKENKE